MIQAYPREPSVVAGGSLRLHVSTDAPRFRVEFYHQREHLVHVGTSAWQPGVAFAPGRPDQDWGWPGYTFPIPLEWPSGAYIAMLVEGDERGEAMGLPDSTTADGREGKALFVVRNARPGEHARILYKLSWATYHAYNASGGSSMYVSPTAVPNTELTRVTTLRPGGGTGGELSFPAEVDVYDPSSPREGFAHWDVPFIRWLEREGYRVDFCTDLDLHQDAALLKPYALLLSVGHDEYWSEPMRAHVERFVADGGNVAFFSANTCWWHIEFVDGDSAFVCRHPAVTEPGMDQWWQFAPENGMTGVSYRNGGGWWRGPREPLGYSVQHAEHWVFNGTDLQNGDTFGAEERLVGYECDGAHLRHAGKLALPVGDDGTPLDLAILGVARLGPGWQDRPRGENATAVMGLHGTGGTVFTCGTTDWARVLERGEPRVERITRNVLDHLSRASVRIDGPFPARCGRLVAVGEQEACFQAAMAELRGWEQMRFSWTVTPGEGIREDGPLFVARMPRAGTLVTVTVSVSEGEEEKGFGTLTLLPVPSEEALQAEVMSLVQQLAGLAPAPVATEELRDGNRPLGDPLWDPFRDGTRTPLQAPDLEALCTIGKQLLEASERLLAVRLDGSR